MKATEFIAQLSAAVGKHGDLELVVGYDSHHTPIEGAFDDGDESWDGGSFRFGPRNLVLDGERDRETGKETGRKVFRI